jgi:hypothetical protein
LRQKSRSIVSWPIFSYNGASKGLIRDGIAFRPGMASGEQRCRALQQSLFPGMDLAGVHPETAG